MGRIFRACIACVGLGSNVIVLDYDVAVVVSFPFTWQDPKVFFEGIGEMS